MAGVSVLTMGADDEQTDQMGAGGVSYVQCSQTSVIRVQLTASSGQ